MVSIHHPCATPYRMNISGMKIQMANVTNPDNLDKLHRQETNRGTPRSSSDSPCSPMVEQSDRYLPFQHTSIAAFVWISHINYSTLPRNRQLLLNIQQTAVKKKPKRFGLGF